MSIFQVPLLVDVYDGTGALIEEGAAYFTPSVNLLDTTDHIYVWQEPRPLQLGSSPQQASPAPPGPGAGSVLPLIMLWSTDSSNISPGGWNWGVTFQAQGAPPPFSFPLLAGSSNLAFTNPQPAVGAPYVFTAAGSAYTANQPVALMVPVGAASNPLPSGMNAGVPYYVTNPSGTSFSLAAYPGGPALGPLLSPVSAGSGIVIACQYLSQQAQVPGVIPVVLSDLDGGTAFTGTLPVGSVFGGTASG